MRETSENFARVDEVKTIITLRSGRQVNQPMPKPKEKKKKRKNGRKKKMLKNKKMRKWRTKMINQRKMGLLVKRLRRKINSYLHLFQNPFNQARW